MKMLLTMISLFTICLISQNALAAQTKSPTKYKGFLGTYHPFNGTAYGGDGWKEGELLQNAFAFGENSFISQLAHGGYNFAKHVNNNCETWDVNKIYGIVRPPSEAGAVKQASDTDLLKPFRYFPGMVQGASRFSKLSRQCPQIAGLIIDDIYNNYPKFVRARHLEDIRDALRGKIVGKQGEVDHTSPETTSHLKLFVVVYEHELFRVDDEILKYVDGVNFWVWKQTEHHKLLDEYLGIINKTYPGKEIISGVYVFNGGQTPTAKSVQYLIKRNTELYAEGKINGLLMFSPIWMGREKMTRKRWNELALPKTLNSVYYPFLGSGSGRVVDGESGKPISKALVTVFRKAGNKRLLVSRKLTDEDGRYAFGGWAGGKNYPETVFEIKADKNSSSEIVNVRLRAGKKVQFKDMRLKK